MLKGMLRALTLIRQLILVCILIAAGGYYFYVRTPCHLPIRYSVGTIDSRFGLSQKQLLDATAQAAAVWEKAAGVKLFAYTPGSGMPINLVYDSRQQTTQKNNTLQDSIDKNSGTADSVKAAYNSAEATYKQQQTDYASAQTAYQSALTAYNQKVAYWNARGGAPRSEYQSLQAEQAALQQQAAALETKRTALNAEADQVNTLTAQYNALAAKVNATVSTINQSAGKEFEEGLYSTTAFSSKIDIYEYSNQDKLVRVLAHELGHSLGLPHNKNPESIMYELNQSTNMVPTAEDLADLKSICGV